MYFLNLSLLQFLAVFGSISAISVALYLLDRSRRKLVVSTLRFWIAAEQPAVAARRRRVQQPWSLLLQLRQGGLGEFAQAFGIGLGPLARRAYQRHGIAVQLAVEAGTLFDEYVRDGQLALALRSFCQLLPGIGAGQFADLGAQRRLVGFLGGYQAVVEQCVELLAPYLDGVLDAGQVIRGDAGVLRTLLGKLDQPAAQFHIAQQPEVEELSSHS